MDRVDTDLADRTTWVAGNGMAILRYDLPEDFESLTYIVSGGEPLSESTFKAYQERFNVTLNEGYGLTETTGATHDSQDSTFGIRAGMIGQPPGFLREAAAIAHRHDVLLIADEVATGFGRTGRMLACDHEDVAPDLLCLAKGITGGYLPLAATIASDEVEQAFTGELADRRTLYHGHTYTGNPLACAAALASLELFDQPVHESPDLLSHAQQSAELIRDRLGPLRDARRFRHVLDVRQRGTMVGIEIGHDRLSEQGPAPFDFAARTGARLCHAMRDRGVIVRPLGDVLILMPILATPHDVLGELIDVVVDTLDRFAWPDA